MGSASRQRRVSSFIEEFAKEIADSSVLKPGATLAIQSLQAGPCDGEEGVALYATLVDDDLRDHVVRLEGEFFYPETDEDEMIEMVVENLGLTQEEAIRRLTKAGLLE